MAPSSPKYCDYCHKRGHNVKTCRAKLTRLERAEQFLGEISVAAERENAADSQIKEGVKSDHKDDETSKPFPDARTLQVIGKRIIDEQIEKEDADARKREPKRTKREKARHAKTKGQKEVEGEGREVSESPSERKGVVVESVQKAT